MEEVKQNKMAVEPLKNYSPKPLHLLVNSMVEQQKKQIKSMKFA